MKKLILLAGLTLGFVGFQTSAFAQYVKTYSDSGNWSISYTDVLCIGAPKNTKTPAIAIIGTKAGGYNVMLSYGQSVKWIQNGQPYNLVVMLSSNAGFQGRATGAVGNNGSRSLIFENMPSGNINGFARGNAVTVKVQGKSTLPVIPLKGAAKMISGVRSCMQQKLNSK